MVFQDKRIEWQTPHLSSLESAGFCVQPQCDSKTLGENLYEKLVSQVG